MKRSSMLEIILCALEGTDLRTESPRGYSDKATKEDAELVLRAIEETGMFPLENLWDEE